MYGRPIPAYIFNSVFYYKGHLLHSYHLCRSQLAWGESYWNSSGYLSIHVVHKHTSSVYYCHSFIQHIHCHVMYILNTYDDITDLLSYWWYLFLKVSLHPDQLRSDPQSMGLLPDTQNCGLRMYRECVERCSRHRLQRKLLVSNPGMHHGTGVAHGTWCMSVSLTRGHGENIPGACATRNIAYLVRGPCRGKPAVNKLISARTKTVVTWRVEIREHFNTRPNITWYCTKHINVFKCRSDIAPKGTPYLAVLSPGEIIVIRNKPYNTTNYYILWKSAFMIS